MEITEQVKERMIESLWVKQAIKDCIKEIENDKIISSVATSCGQMLLEGGEEVQVQIVVTRNEEEFLGDFENETTITPYKIDE